MPTQYNRDVLHCLKSEADDSNYAKSQPDGQGQRYHKKESYVYDIQAHGIWLVKSWSKAAHRLWR